MNKSKFALFLASFILVLSFTFSCSSDDGGEDEPNVGTLYSGSSSDGSLYSSSDVGNIPINKKQISGVSQKGPFVIGSTVAIYELDENLFQTGQKTYKSAIIDDKGTFEIENVQLASSYVFLETDGFYRNEVSGEKSVSRITLNAIADIADKSNINVNLLTHLEYNRVINLVRAGKSFAEAKKQAQEEILNAFDISGNFANSEDMSIFGTSESDAALLAISILLQGERGEADFSELLTEFSQSIKEQGKWEDNAKKTAIADWAYSLNLEGIRSNILGWELSSEVPDFEKYIMNFWKVNYGLDVCEAENYNILQNNVNEISKNKDVYFICWNNDWHPLSLYYHNDFWINNPDKTGIFTDERDGQSYFYVKIGEQTWMAENLNYSGNTGNEGNVGLCYGDYSGGHSQYFCSTYGRLYDWATAMNIDERFNDELWSGSDYNNKDICPDDWHLPSDEDWTELMKAVGGTGDYGTEGVASTNLKSKLGWDNNGNGTDEHGFTALPGGSMYLNIFQGAGGDNGAIQGEFQGEYGAWLSSTESGAATTNHRVIYGNNQLIRWNNGDKSDALSVRCVKD